MNHAHTPHTPQDSGNHSHLIDTSETGSHAHTAAAAPEPVVATSAPTTITLDVPIKRGTTTIYEITLRKPNAGELRGLSLQRLHQADADEILKLLPRITSPSLTPPECAQLDPADLSEAGGIIISFLLKKSLRDAVFQSA
jgi:hypothetical protein